MAKAKLHYCANYRGMIDPWVISGAVGQAEFNIYFETRLRPELEPANTVILDNLAAHKRPHAADILRHGFWFLLMPPCTPNLNLIELAIFKLKSHLQRVGIRNCDQLTKATGITVISVVQSSFGNSSTLQNIIILITKHFDLSTRKCAQSNIV